MTTSDIAAALTSAALVTFVATLVIRDRLRERGVAQSLLVADMRASDVAADTLARQVAERRLLDWQAHCEAAFRVAMRPTPRTEPTPIHDELAEERLSAALDDDEAVAEWLEAGS